MPRTLRSALDESNPNKLPDEMQLLRAGRTLSSIPLMRDGAVASHTLVLPETQRAASILSAFRRTGGATGWTTPMVHGTVPAAGQCVVTPTGNILFAAADAVTAADAWYMPEEGDIFQEDVAVAASAATLLAFKAGVILLSAEVLAGVIPGAKTVSLRGAAPGAGFAALSAGGTTVAFNAADVVAGTARVRYIARPSTQPASSVAARMEASVNV